MLSELGGDSAFSWTAPLSGVALGVGVGVAGSLSSILWLNVAMSPVFSWVCIAVVFSLDARKDGFLGWSFWLGILWIPEIRLLVLLHSLPSAAMHAWRLRRGRSRLFLEIPLAALLGLAIALAFSVAGGNGWRLRLSETIFLVAYFLGNVLAMDLALRISARKANASPN